MKQKPNQHSKSIRIWLLDQGLKLGLWDFSNGGENSAQAIRLGCAGYTPWLRRLYKAE